MEVTEEIFFAKQKSFDNIPFIQSYGWYQAMRKGKERFFLDNLENPKIGFWGIITKHRLIGTKLIINGISLVTGIKEKDINEFFSEIIKGCFDFVAISDMNQYNPQFEVGVRRAGFKRPYHLDLCPMSLLVDLEQSFNFHRMWKRSVKKSKDAENKFVKLDKVGETDINDFLALFNQLKNRKSLGYSLENEQIQKLISQPEYFMSFVETNEGKRIASRITYLQNGHAYDIFAANSEESLKSGAVYHLQEGLLSYLKEVGAKDFDYGRIPPSKGPMDNIYVSKMYSGGSPIGYNGEWLYCKSEKKYFIYTAYSTIRGGFKRSW